MDIEEYYGSLNQLADEYSLSEISTHDFLERLVIEERPKIDNLVNFRKTFVGAKELDEVRPYLIIGLFRQYDGVERASCFVICFELDELATKKSWRQRCDRYKKTQPLFVKAKDLWDHTYDEELIDFSITAQISDSEILSYKNCFTRIDAALNPLIASWTRATFPNKKIYVRANPFMAFDTQPAQRLFESILMPANPNWWRNLTIHNRTKEGASYILDECTPSDDPQKYWELHIKNIKRLEVIAKRNNNGNLSMMIEEITNIDKKGLMFGRCIHLDTDAKYGTPFEESELNHLDLAINIYEGESAKKRLNDNLSSGLVTTDASYRTHLLRVEKIPFKSLFGFVISFFRSRTLVNEWFEDQFHQGEN